MPCFVWKFAKKRKRNVLRKRRRAVVPKRILSVSAYGSPSPLPSGGKHGMPTASSLYLTWLPPQYPLNLLSPKVKYPTTKDIPTWLRVTPVPEVFAETYPFPSPASKTHICDGAAANSIASTSRRLRPEDLCVWLPIHPRDSLGPSHRVSDNCPGIMSYECASPRCVGQVDTEQQYSRGQGKRKRAIPDLNKPLPALPPSLSTTDLFSSVTQETIRTSVPCTDRMVQVVGWI